MSVKQFLSGEKVAAPPSGTLFPQTSTINIGRKTKAEGPRLNRR